MRLMIVTDVCLFREGLSRVLAGCSNVQIVAATPSSNDVPAVVATHRPDIVLVDAATVRASELIPHVTQAFPETRVVAFAVAEEDEEEVLACAEAGVAGFVARNATVEELIAVLHSAIHGELRCPPHIAAVVFRQVARLAGLRLVTAHKPGLTHREAEVVSLIEDGLTNKEIAGRLSIEVATVKNHVHNILEKLHVRRRGDVASFVRSQERWRRRPGPRPSAGSSP
jgi:two-component system, NarL family, nitrate/nitrite response regulator NarL